MKTGSSMHVSRFNHNMRFHSDELNFTIPVVLYTGTIEYRTKRIGTFMSIAVVPVAGLGTRLLPLTKSKPKEIQTKPIAKTKGIQQ